jgi:hypothetical protein
MTIIVLRQAAANRAARDHALRAIAALKTIAALRADATEERSWAKISGRGRR